MAKDLKDLSKQIAGYSKEMGRANRQATSAAAMQYKDAVLDAGVLYVRPGGRLIYVTCSVLAEENEDRVSAFLARHPEFSVRPATDDPERLSRLTPEGYLRLTPATSDTDGFFVAVLARADGRTPA